MSIQELPLARPTRPALDPALLRAGFGHFPSGLAALCAIVDGEARGLIASSFSVGVSFEPPLVLFSVQNSSTTWPILRRAERIGISILGREHSDLARTLASRTADRFAGLDYSVTDAGSILLERASILMDCEITSETPAGDHHIVVLEVLSMELQPTMEPLVYHQSRFRELAPSSND